MYVCVYMYVCYMHAHIYTKSLNNYISMYKYLHILLLGYSIRSVH